MHGVTSIILVTHNQLAYTKLCVESIARQTAEPYELVVVDNGSTDGTVEWLKFVGEKVSGDRFPARRDADASVNGDGQGESGTGGQGENRLRPTRVTVIANSENRGFPAAANQGIAAATGQQILLLNNDTLVTPGWLGRLVRALHSDATLGMVGPVSNFVSGPQCVPAPYESRELRADGRETKEDGPVKRIEGRPGGTVFCDLEKLDEFVRAWGQANGGRIVETPRLVGFCLLIRREVVDRIGLLDERFGIGNFEDDDYCRRAREAGFRMAIVPGAFVHHFGGRTFIGSGVDHGALMRRNEQLYREKWNESVQYSVFSVQKEAVSNQPSAINEPHSVVVSANPKPPIPSPLISLCMIARDNEQTIGAALEVIRKHVDDIVVVDTGSTDRTPEIAASLGARVFHFPWCDDFSAARNESIRHALGEWIFWMDTDDITDDENASKIRELVMAVEKRGQVQLTGTALRVLRINWTRPLFRRPSWGF